MPKWLYERLNMWIGYYIYFNSKLKYPLNSLSRSYLSISMLKPARKF